MRVGLDFDNTLIRYDELFHNLALEQGLIPDTLPAQKNRIRDHLRQQQREEEWTRLQGEVYGNRILEAVAWEGMWTALSELQDTGIKFYLVSHKTRTPYLGPAYDLHAAARNWLTKQEFFSAKGLHWRDEHVYFELTKADKIQRIQQLRCAYFVDDLPEILEMLPPSVKGILFRPKVATEAAEPSWPILQKWSELPDLLQ
tara:strand:- start:350 stop:949 length:600 start_codon:yes stop_codon:yes gene_type:complete